MKKRTLKLRDYQYAPYYFALQNKRVVLALSPNSGKTEISIAVIEKFIKDNPLARVLVLAHSTNVLLDNFFERIQELDINFTYSKDVTDSSQVHVCIPHAEIKLVAKYDLIIVDEAHENYLEDRVQRIINNHKKAKQVLLTGTPSKFIKAGGYKIFAIAANEIPEEYFAKLGVEIIASDYDWKKEDYNSLGDLSENFNFTEDATLKTLEMVLEQLLKRVSTKVNVKTFNIRNLINNFKTWIKTYKKLGKTMIVCRNIKQADLVYRILKEKGVEAMVSHSKSDVDNLVVNQFKKQNSGVLVVVNRARLGYNDETLMNLIDLSGTHNPDIIYQMMCRTLRGNPEDHKYYLKVSPKDSPSLAITHISLCAALMLTDKKYLETYNGSNFNDLQMPVIKREYDKLMKVKGKSRKLTDHSTILPDYSFDIIDTFREITKDLNNPNTIYKMTTIGDVRRELLGDKIVRNLSIMDVIKNAAGDKMTENDYTEIEKDLKEKNLV